MNDQIVVVLPKPSTKGEVSIEGAISQRRTVRRITKKPVNMKEISQLLWSLQGVTLIERMPDGTRVLRRTAPSAGRNYPLEVYVLTPDGLYYYSSEDHELLLETTEDRRKGLVDAVYSHVNKHAVEDAPLVIVIAANNERVLRITPLLEDATRFVHLEIGHATQNLLLQATALKLGVCSISSFNVGRVYKALKLPALHRPVYLLTIGHPATT